MTVGERIKKKRERLNISQVDLARKIDCTKQTLYKYENSIITNIPSDKIEKIARALFTTPAYLMGWEESSPANKLDYSKISNIMPLPYKEGRTVPLIGSIACGVPILADENIEKEVMLPEDISADFCLRCKGDSMINARIYDGDIVFIRKQPMVENGEIAAVLIDEMADVSSATLKRVYLYDDKITLSAENPKYAPTTYFREEMNNIRILGKAVACLTNVN
jgi:repressor LexA